MQIRHSRTATFILGALLSTGMVLAQQAQPQQTPDASQANTAQPSPSSSHHANPNRQARRLKKELNLSQDQVAQIKPILADRVQQMQALRADTSLAQTDRRAKARAIMQDSRTKIEAVLNDQQKQQFEQLQAKRRARHHRGQSTSQPGA